MVPTLETKGPGRYMLNRNKRTLHTAVWFLDLSSNWTNHSRVSEEMDRPNPLPMAGRQHLSAAITSLPNLLWLLFSAVKTNLTTTAEPASSLTNFPLGVTKLSFP